MIGHDLKTCCAKRCAKYSYRRAHAQQTSLISFSSHTQTSYSICLCGFVIAFLSYWFMESCSCCHFPSFGDPGPGVQLPYPNRDLIFPTFNEFLCTRTFTGTSTSTIIWTDGRESSFLNNNTTNRDSHPSHRIAHLDKGYSQFSQASLRIFLPAGMANRNQPSLWSS